MLPTPRTSIRQLLCAGLALGLGCGDGGLDPEALESAHARRRRVPVRPIAQGVPRRAIQLGPSHYGQPDLQATGGDRAAIVSFATPDFGRRLTLRVGPDGSVQPQAGVDDLNRPRLFTDGPGHGVLWREPAFDNPFETTSLTWVASLDEAGLGEPSLLLESTQSTARCPAGTSVEAIVSGSTPLIPLRVWNNCNGFYSAGSSLVPFHGGVLGRRLTLRARAFEPDSPQVVGPTLGASDERVALLLWREDSLQAVNSRDTRFTPNGFLGGFVYDLATASGVPFAGLGRMPDTIAAGASIFLFATTITAPGRLVIERAVVVGQRLSKEPILVIPTRDDPHHAQLIYSEGAWTAAWCEGSPCPILRTVRLGHDLVEIPDSRQILARGVLDYRLMSAGGRRFVAYATFAGRDVDGAAYVLPMDDWEE